MDCIKGTNAEAVTLKGIAVKRIKAGDYVGARNAILKAQDIFPDLENISPMVTVCNVLWAAEMEFPGYGIDWYWVLELPPSVEDIEIVTQYEKLSSLIESVQTQFPGADSAMKLIEEAFSVLSNWAKRSAFDSKRRAFGRNGGLLDSELKGGGPADEVFDESTQRSVSSKLPSKRVRDSSGSVDSVIERLAQEVAAATHAIDRKKDFAQGQIWAIFGGRDAMPRQYVKINSVISASKLCVTFLEPNPVHYDEMCWVEEDLPFGCGIFKLDKTTFDLEKTKLSHIVHCESSPKKSFYKIYPREGEIWALYKNWHKKWHSSDHEKYPCEVVEILQDFDEEEGMSVCRLVQLQGCKTFFRRQLDQGVEMVRSLSRAEMLGFSHRIPESTVLGIERFGIPKGSWHLEPDALPLEFL